MWVFPIGFEQSEEAGLFNTQQFLEVIPCDLSLTVALKQDSDLLIREAFVNLALRSLLSFKKEESISEKIPCRNTNGSVFNFTQATFEL